MSRATDDPIDDDDRGETAEEAAATRAKWDRQVAEYLDLVRKAADDFRNLLRKGRHVANGFDGSFGLDRAADKITEAEFWAHKEMHRDRWP